MKTFEEYRSILFHMNHDMLGLGAPVEKDDVGYNRPDFCRMENLGYYPEVMLNEMMCYKILEVLSNYRNTQLSECCELLDEMKKFFSEILPDTTKLELKVLDVPVYLDGVRDSTGILLNHFAIDDELKDYIYETQFGRWIKDEKGQKRLKLKWKYMDEMLNHFSSHGFITDRLEELIKEGKEGPVEETGNEDDRPLVSIIKAEDGFMYLKTDYNKKMVAFVRSSETARTVKVGEDWAVKAPIHGSEALVEKYEEEGFNVGDVKKLIADTPATEVAKDRVKVNMDERGIMYLSYPYNSDIVSFTRQNNERFTLLRDTEGNYCLKVDPYDCEDLVERFIAAGFCVNDLADKISKLKSDTTPVKFDIIYHNGHTVITQNKVNPYVQGLFKAGICKKWSEHDFEIVEEEKAFKYLKSSKDQFEAGSGLMTWMDRMSEMSKVYTVAAPEVVPFEPYEFQMTDIKEMLEKKRVLLANDMGCGKTMESVWVGLSLPFTKLVICPPSLRLNWLREIKNFAPDADAEIIYSNTEKIERHDWMIIGYPSVVKHLDKLLAMNIRCVMADEAHYIKAINVWGEPSSQRAEAVLELASRADYCYAITGTPKTSRNKDVYNLLRFIKHPLAKDEFISYAEKYCDGHHEEYGYSFDGNSNDKELNELIRPYMIRHLKSDVLPDLRKQRQGIPVETNIREYNKYMEQAVKELTKNNSKANGAVLALLTKARQSLALSKVAETCDLANTILDNGESLVIATCFTGVVEKLEKKFKDDCCKIVGGMSDKAKQQAIDAFQNGQKKVIILNVQAGGVGITLTKSHVMIFNDFAWTTGELTQMEDRICRAGQTETCIIYYMISEGVEVEQKMMGDLTEKSETINNAIDDGLGENINIYDLIKEVDIA